MVKLIILFDAGFFDIFFRVFTLLPNTKLLTLRNTRVVLSDDEDDGFVVEFQGTPAPHTNLTSLVVDFTVPLALLEFVFQCVPHLEHLSLGHGRHR